MEQWKDIEILHAKKMEALGQLAGGVAHDFNNVLSIIEGYSRLIKRHIDEENPAYSMVDNVMEASRRGTSLTRRLLAFGRQKMMIDTCCDLVKAIRDHQILLKPLLMPRVKVLMNLPDEEIYVACDRDLIWQVLLNTCLNSRDAMTEDGLITVDVIVGEDESIIEKIKAEHGYVEIVITDDGPGMSDEIAERAFEPFFTTKEQGKGTGLGLPMIYGLVQQLGGKVDLKTAEGLGTSVTVYLPLSDRKPEEKEAAQQNNYSLEGKTVLVVEDERELLMLNQQVLEELGMRALTAIDGDDALAVQDKHEGQIDLLLTDLIMPNMGGVKLANLFTSVREETAVVYITGYPAHDRRLEDLNLPDEAVILSKPAQPEEIEKALQQALKKRQASNIEQLKKDTG